MKLELKHLAPYLPYVIECVADDGFRGVLMQLALKEVDFDFQVKLADGNNFQWRYLEGVKPILRPLSDLTKEIEHNGESIILIDILEQNVDVDYLADCGIWTQRLFDEQKIFCIELIPFGIIDKLLEYHFDIFGLIKKGLAIDINTIEND